MTQATYYSYKTNFMTFQNYDQAQQDHSLDYQFRLPADYAADLKIRKNSHNSGKTTRGISPKSDIKRRLPISNSPNNSQNEFADQATINDSSCYQYIGQPDWSNNMDVSPMSMMFFNESTLVHETTLRVPRNNAGKRSQASTYTAASDDTKLKYKTEMCRNFESTGRCKFGNKCSFAHGKDELLNKKHINLHYKSKRCNKFFDNGFCEYGSRCQYLHKEDSFSHILDSYCEKLLVWIDRNPNLDMSSIMKKTHTFGSRNSFFQSLETKDSSFTFSEHETQ